MQIAHRAVKAALLLTAFLAVADERGEESPPASVILGQHGHPGVRRTHEESRTPVVEWMRERRRRLDPLEPVLR